MRFGMALIKNEHGVLHGSGANRIHGIATGGPIMRAHHAIVIVSAILVVFGLTLIFFSAPITVADASVVKRERVRTSLRCNGVSQISRWRSYTT
jgi:hypothetical protein